MSLLADIENTLPDHYTLSNKTLIIIGQVMDETIYFYKELGQNTTVILLTQPECYAIKQIFLEFMNNTGTTVIDIKNKVSNNDNYRLDNRSVKIIMNLLKEYNYSKILTHPSTVSNPQNRELNKLITEYMKIRNKDNHYTYDKTYKTKMPYGIQKGILELYCRAPNKDGSLDMELYKYCINIASHISGIKKI